MAERDLYGNERENVVHTVTELGYVHERKGFGDLLGLRGEL